MNHRLRPGSVASRMVEMLAVHRCAPRSGLVYLTNADADNVSASLTYLITRKRVVEIGTIDQARAAKVEFVAGHALRSLRGNARIYALTGTPLLPPIGRAPPVRRSRSCSTGVPAGRRTIPAYRWFVDRI